MNPRHRLYLVATLVVLCGFGILFGSYTMLRSRLSLKNYEEAFQQVKHPPATARIDSFALQASYYPATYVDDSISSKGITLVGELRSYTGDWQNIQAFYLKSTEGDSWPVSALPVEIRSKQGQTILQPVSAFSYDPFDYDLLENLKSYYRSKEISPQEAEGKFYLVYFTPNR